MKNITSRAQIVWPIVKRLALWLALSVLIGALSGIIGTAFHIGVEKVTELRLAHSWILWLLPVIGLGIVAIYQYTKTQGKGTNDVVEELLHGKGLPLALLPAIFVSTVLTHLGGGSAGREGAALQMGGSLGFHTGRLFRLDEEDRKSTTMVGMAAFFSALFGTPVGATFFALGIASVGEVRHRELLPALVASYTAYGVSMLCGVEPTRFRVTVPSFDWFLLIRVAVLGILCAILSVLFVETIHFTEHRLAGRITNPYFRIALGGLMIAGLTFLLGTQDYNGAGMGVIAAAIEEGRAFSCAFLLKLLFTALTLGTGFKGGEVVPSFFVGATFGCVAGPILGIPAGCAAAVGMISVFCGAVNSPLASVILALELFGGEGLPFYALACALAYAFSGYSSLYPSQRILFSKILVNKTDRNGEKDEGAEPTSVQE